VALFLVAMLLHSGLAREIFVRGMPSVSGPDGSPERPFRTIGDALKAAGAGDTVTVHGGVYRESVRISGGSETTPLVLRAARGERVVITGATRISGWRKRDGPVFTAAVDFKPERLLVDLQDLPMAQEPDEGWWQAEEVEELTLVDKRHLVGLAPAIQGGEAYIWTRHGNTFFTAPVKQLDPDRGTLTVEQASRWMRLTRGDRYTLRNHPAWIDRPGEWAVEALDGKDESGYRVHLWPPDPSVLERVEAPRESRRVLLVQNAENVRLEGLEVSSSAKTGIEVSRSRNIEILRCVTHNNGQTGVGARDCRDISVRQCISWHNYLGVTLHTVEGALVEECDIGHNGMDGLIVSWNTDDVTIRRCCIHHHLLWGHPDNLQVYRGVTGLRLIDNLLLAGGQSIMMEETSGGILKGNMIIGCGAYSVILGHGNSKDYRIQGNTIAFSGYGCLNLTASDYDVCENVFMTGHDGPAYGVRGVSGYKADRNLFFKARELDNTQILVSDRGWNQSLEQFREATGQDRNSVVGDPEFRNAPVAYGVVDSGRLTDCTRDTWFLGRGAELFGVGDTIEVDFDGKARKVTHREGDRITVSPGLAGKPIKGLLLCNWGRQDPGLDLRLREGSPGAELSASGGPVGSRIDIQAYLRGDFDGDGRRDLPALPTSREARDR
jgi:hypothetical protein